MLKVNSSVKNGTAEIILEGELTVYTAAVFKSAVLSISEKYGEMIINLAGISEADSSGIQLLMGLKRTLSLDNRQLVLKSHSPAIIKMMDLYGLIGFFGDIMRIPSSLKPQLGLAYGIKRGN